MYCALNTFTLLSSSAQHEQDTVYKHKALAATIHLTGIIQDNKYIESLISEKLAYSFLF